MNRVKDFSKKWKPKKKSSHDESLIPIHNNSEEEVYGVSRPDYRSQQTHPGWHSGEVHSSNLPQTSSASRDRLHPDYGSNPKPRSSKKHQKYRDEAPPSNESERHSRHDADPHTADGYPTQRHSASPHTVREARNSSQVPPSSQYNVGSQQWPSQQVPPMYYSPTIPSNAPYHASYHVPPVYTNYPGYPPKAPMYQPIPSHATGQTYGAPQPYPPAIPQQRPQPCMVQQQQQLAPVHPTSHIPPASTPNMTHAGKESLEKDTQRTQKPSHGAENSDLGRRHSQEPRYTHSADLSQETTTKSSQSLQTCQRPEHGRPEHGRPEHGRPEHRRSEHGRSEHGRSEHGRSPSYHNEIPALGRSEHGRSEHSRSERGRPPSYHNEIPALALVGNPGAGKSTILNGFIDKVAFEAGISLGSGLTTTLKEYDHEGVTLYDTPGLADIERKKEAGLELDKLLSKHRPLKIAFVVTLESGRVRPEDALTIELILDAIRFDTNNRFGVIINQVTEKVRKELNEYPEKEAVIRQNLTRNRSTIHWCYVSKRDELTDEKDRKLMTPELVHFFWSLPETKPRNARTIPIDTESMEEKLEMHMELIRDMESANAEQLRKMTEELMSQKAMYAAQEARLRQVEENLIRDIQKAKAEAAAAKAEAERSRKDAGSKHSHGRESQNPTERRSEHSAKSQHNRKLGRDLGAAAAVAAVPAIIGPSVVHLYKQEHDAKVDEADEAHQGKGQGTSSGPQEEPPNSEKQLDSGGNRDGRGEQSNYYPLDLGESTNDRQTELHEGGSGFENSNAFDGADDWSGLG